MCATPLSPLLVYKVTMESFEDQNSTSVYKMRINQVIKEGKRLSALNNNLSAVHEIQNLYICSKSYNSFNK